jgi:hypothetical protein
MMQGRLFWAVWLLVGCQLVWTAMRALAAPWVWNPYQLLTLVFFSALAVGLTWLGVLWQREGAGGLKAKIAAFETEMETPGSAIALRWTVAFWLVAGALVFAYFQMEQQ